MGAYYAYPPKSSFRYGRLDKIFYKNYKILLQLVNVRQIYDLGFHEPDAGTHINAISNIILASPTVRRPRVPNERSLI